MSTPIRGYKSVTPLGDYLLCVVIEQEDTSGGLIIPETARQEFPAYARVLEVGPDITDIKAGDCIYPRIGASLMKVYIGPKGELHYLLKRDQVTALIEPPETSMLTVVDGNLSLS